MSENKKNLLFAGIVSVVFLLFMEVSSFIINEIYRNFFSTASTLDNSAINKGAKKADPSSFRTQFISDKKIELEFDKYRGNFFTIQSYETFNSTPYQSPYINIDNFGVRLNRSPKEEKNKKQKTGVPITIWMMGSSALFGTPKTADYETIPAYLEDILNKRYSACNFTVKNFGAIFSKTFEDYARFLKRLMFERPDLVIAHNGWNDIKAWTGALDSGLIGEIRKAVQFYMSNDVISITAIKNNIRGVMKFLFPNTISLFNKGRKLFSLIAANSNIERWKDSYKKEREYITKLREKKWAVDIKFYRETLENFVDTTKRHGIPLILSIQPNVFVSSKPLFSSEKTWMLVYKHVSFAYTDDDLNSIDRVQSYNLNHKKLHMLTLESFKKAYNEARDEMQKAAKSSHALFFNAQTLIDPLEDAAVFVDQVHLTAFGNSVVAKGLSDLISPIFNNRVQGEKVDCR